MGTRTLPDLARRTKSADAGATMLKRPKRHHYLPQFYLTASRATVCFGRPTKENAFRKQTPINAMMRRTIQILYRDPQAAAARLQRMKAARLSLI